jgi:hypothetical protein
MTKQSMLPVGCLLLSTALALIPAQAHAEQPPAIDWLQNFGVQNGLDAPEILNLVLDDQGQVQLFGKRNRNNEVGYVRTYSPTGTLVSNIDVSSGTANPDHGFRDSWLDANGNTYWTVGAHSFNPGHGRLRKLSPSGALLWERISGSGSDGWWFGVTGDDAGSVYATGQTTGGIGGPNAGLTDSTLHKYSSSGQLQWVRQFGGAGYDTARLIAPDLAGNVVLAGESSIGSSSYHVFLTKFDDQGVQQWNRVLGGPQSTLDALTADEAGDSFVSQSVGPFGLTHVAINKYSPEGRLLWIREIAPPSGGGTFTTDLTTDSIGNLYVAALSRVRRTINVYDSHLYKYDPSGTLLWSLFFDDLELRKIAVDDMGRIAVAGLYSSLRVEPAEKWVGLIRQQGVPEPAGATMVLLASVMPLMLGKWGHKSVAIAASTATPPNRRRTIDS